MLSGSGASEYQDIPERHVPPPETEEYRRYLQNPERLRKDLARQSAEHVVIDEIQKVPQLLDEAHWLIENQGVCFALCGSSARKVKRPPDH